MMPIAGTSLEIIASSATATVGAQIAKCLIYTVIKKPVSYRMLVHTGGMPSSHSALVASLATSVGLIEGFDASLFAITIGFAVIVMYDAAGLRRSAGRMAGILNQLTQEIYSNNPAKVPERLRELLGHTPIEVIVGALWGSLIAYLFNAMLG
ncbi:MAG: divergent PAP2 family protein [Cyanobacteria bacterium P01_H01_bin.74]